MTMPRHNLGRIIHVFALLMIALASSVTAQARQASSASPAGKDVLNGRNVMSVTISQDGQLTGELHKADGASWIELDAAGKAISRYTETKRDDWSVYLADPARSVKLQLDLRAHIASYITGTMRHRDFYDISSASTDIPVQRAQDGALASSPQRQSGPVTSRSRVLPARVASPSFCLNETITRGPGMVPGRVADCPAGFVNNGAACTRAAQTIAAPSRAPECPAGYSANGANCERPAVTKANAHSRPADCPKGYSNAGKECFRLSASTLLGASEMSCKGSETKVGARCYKACEAGYTNEGEECVRPASTVGPEKMSCKAGYRKSSASQRCVADCADGYASTGEACFRAASTLGTESMSCKAGETRSGGRCLAANGGCANGQVQQGGLCYTACAAGYEGVGAVCLAAPPRAWIQCGMGSAKDTQACAAAVFEPLALVKQMAISVGQRGGTAASSGAAQKAARLATMQKKFKELNDAYNKAKDSAGFNSALDAWTKAHSGKDGQSGYASFDKMASAATEDDMVRYAAQLVEIVGVNNGAAVVGAPAYPKCSALFPSGL
jgi:hypothetical protein